MQLSDKHLPSMHRPLERGEEEVGKGRREEKRKGRDGVIFPSASLNKLLSFR